MLNFEHPILLSLILGIPAGLWFQNYFRNSGGRFPFPFRLWSGDGFRPGHGFLDFLLVFSGVLFWGGFLSLVIALAGPQITRQERIYTHQGKEIIFVLDQSPSMSASDFPPENRFETAKSMIDGFMEERVNDAIGLVGFGTESVLWVPPTTDYRFLKSRLENIHILDLGEGTAIGMGLSVAALHLSRNANPDRVIVLLTDGDSNAGEIQPEMAARIAGELGIKIYCIGIGSHSDVPIDYTDPKTGKRISGLARKAFNEELLMEIARTTGGGYYRAITPGVLQTIFLTIDTLESTEKKMKIQVVTRPVHRVFLLLGFIMMLLNFVLRKIILREVL